MKTFLAPESPTTFIAPAGGVVSGTGLMIGSLFVIPVADAAEDEEFSGYSTGVFTHAKVTAQAWTEGQKVYWKSDTEEFTTDGSAGPLVGVAAAVAANPSATGEVRLNGTPSDAGEGAQANIAALTEDGGAIGGTSDGDLPDLTATAVAPTTAAAAAAATAGGATPTAAQVDAGIATAVAPLDTSIASLDTQVTALIADNVALRAAVRELAEDNNAIKALLVAYGAMQAP